MNAFWISESDSQSLYRSKPAICQISLGLSNTIYTKVYQFAESNVIKILNFCDYAYVDNLFLR